MRRQRNGRRRRIDIERRDDRCDVGIERHGELGIGHRFARAERHVREPRLINDASSGLACGAAPITASGALADPSDVDLFQIYTDSTSCAAPDPELHVTTAGPVDVCFYVEACSSSLPLLTCPSGTHGEADTDHAITGCCGTIDGTGTIGLSGAKTCPDFNVKLYVELQNATACSDYSFDVSL